MFTPLGINHVSMEHGTACVIHTIIQDFMRQCHYLTFVWSPVSPGWRLWSTHITTGWGWRLPACTVSWSACPSRHIFNTLRPRQNGWHFADDTFKRIFLNENVIISIKMSLKFVPNGPINNIPALVQIMAWHRPGDKPLSEAMMVNLQRHICVTRPQWVNSSPPSAAYMRQWIGSALVQIMACRLFGAKPLPEPILTCW